MEARTDVRPEPATTASPAWRGACFCGAVQLSVRGEPVAMGYCHCDSCRRWSAAPVNAFTLWRPEALRITSGAERIGSYAATPHSQRKWCTACGGHLYTEHPGLGLVDVYAAVLPGLAFRPRVHVNYAETRLPLHDGLPKLQDMPAEMGGSGRTVPE